MVKPLDKNLPKHLASWGNWANEDGEDLRIIIDFEEVFQGAEPARRQLRVPETIFTKPFDHRVDLWRTGCVVRRRVDDINTCRFMLTKMRFPDNINIIITLFPCILVMIFSIPIMFSVQIALSGNLRGCVDE